MEQEVKNQRPRHRSELADKCACAIADVEAGVLVVAGVLGVPAISFLGAVTGTPLGRKNGW
jgi:hypothetical protein